MISRPAQDGGFKTHVLTIPLRRDCLNTLIKIILILRLRLSDLVDELETTDRLTVRATAAFRRIDVAIVVEAQVVRAAIARRSRPIVAVVADTVETEVDAAITRSRIPDGRCAAELAGEIPAIVGSVV